MKTLEEFDNFYSTELIKALEEIDKDRKSRIKRVFRNFFIYLLSAAGLIAIGLFVNHEVYGELIPSNEDNIPLTISIILAILGIFVLGYFNDKLRKEYTKVFKELIIKRIVQFVHDGLEYFPTEMISMNDFCKSEIFKQIPDRYFGDDMVKGKIDKTDICFSEVHAKYKTRSGDEDNKEKWHDLFDGLFFIADFHKNFQGKYFVLPDFAEKTFGGIGKFFQKLNKMRGQLVHLEDPEFEKAFAVYGSDQVEARYILSSNMMRRLLDFKNRTGKNIMLSFVDSSLYLAIPYRRKLFEPKFFSTVVNKEKTTEYFSDFQIAISVVEDLNLNTRIWGKD